MSAWLKLDIEEQTQTLLLKWMDPDRHIFALLTLQKVAYQLELSVCGAC